MRRISLASFLILCLAAASVRAASEPAAPRTAADFGFAADDWPWWRGPARDGHAAANQSLPLQWSDGEHVVWKVPVPGRGHGSPIVVGDRIYLNTADEEREVQSLLCFSRATGELIWQQPVHEGGFVRGGNQKSSQASSTPACDGERLFVTFLNRDAVYATALDFDGHQIWQKKVSDFVVHQGFAASPAVFGPLVLIAADHKGGGGGAVAALDRATGDVVWKHNRPATANYASPIIVQAAGRDQVIFQGCDLVSAYDPLTGVELWKRDGSTTECVTSIVTDGEVVITSGGYPRNHVAAVRADGSNEIAWENGERVYVPSMLMQEGYLYAVTDDGVAICWQARDGEEQWKGRLGGTFSASPVLAGERIYCINEAGECFVFRADPNQFTLLGESRLGDEVFATPTICGGRIYQRVAERDGETRQEYLYCIGE